MADTRLGIYHGTSEAAHESGPTLSPASERRRKVKLSTSEYCVKCTFACEGNLTEQKGRKGDISWPDKICPSW